jgi:hypothetical protein
MLHLRRRDEGTEEDGPPVVIETDHFAAPSEGGGLMDACDDWDLYRTNCGRIQCK